MKKKLKKVAFAFVVSVVFVVSLLVVIVISPGLTYANKSIHNNFTVYSDHPYDTLLHRRLDSAMVLLKKSELYQPNLTFDICLNDGSVYPAIMDKILGQSFASGFYNKVVLHGTLNAAGNYVELNGYRWNLTQLLAHEVTHCLQYYHLGLWKSSPLGNIPLWKKEGYPEYVARQNADQLSLSQNIKRMNDTMQKDKDGWGISFADSTFAGREYYSWWLAMQYCMNIKKMTYMDVLRDTTSLENINQQMMRWYTANKK